VDSGRVSGTISKIPREEAKEKLIPDAKPNSSDTTHLGETVHEIYDDNSVADLNTRRPGDTKFNDYLIPTKVR